MNWDQSCDPKDCIGWERAHLGRLWTHQRPSTNYHLICSNKLYHTVYHRLISCVKYVNTKTAVKPSLLSRVDQNLQRLHLHPFGLCYRLFGTRMDARCLRTDAVLYFWVTTIILRVLAPFSRFSDPHLVTDSVDQELSEALSDRMLRLWVVRFKLHIPTLLRSKKRSNSTREMNLFFSLCLSLSIFLSFSTLSDWCCFYHLVRNGLVALLEALCARTVPSDSWMSVFFEMCKMFINNRTS